MILRTLSIWVLGSLVWAALVVGGTIGGWGRTAIAPPGDTRAFIAAATARIDREYQGNAAFLLMERGQVVATHFVSKGKAVDENTRFQVASLSKWITAWGVMTLVDAGKLDLDAPVSRYLKRWKLPPSKFNNDAVTARRLLSHTAGLTDGLGYGGYKPGQQPQTLEQSLTRASDASPGASGITQVGQKPGQFDYSGGGYTLLQLLIEEISGQSFNDYMKAAVFTPLGMTGSTFILDDQPTNLADFFDTNGGAATHFRFTGLAAASLYTSVGDLSRFLAAHIAMDGQPAGRGVLKPETLKHMRAPEAKLYGVDVWGLGAILYAPNNHGDYVIGHDGSNEPAINTTARIDPTSGDGIIMLESGNRRLATDIAGEWIFWRTGNVDFVTITLGLADTLKLLGIGVAAIFVIALVIAALTRRRRA